MPVGIGFGIVDTMVAAPAFGAEGSACEDQVGDVEQVAGFDGQFEFGFGGGVAELQGLGLGSRGEVLANGGFGEFCLPGGDLVESGVEGVAGAVDASAFPHEGAQVLSDGLEVVCFAKPGVLNACNF